MTDQDKMRRGSLLATLMFANGYATARALRDELETVHGVAVTLDRVKADLVKLADQGLVQRREDLACITEDGRSVVRGLRELP